MIDGLLSNATATNGAGSTTWLNKTPSDILADVNAAMAAMWKPPVWPAFPEMILVHHRHIYPTPVRFKVAGKRRREHRPLRMDAIERERLLQARGVPVREGIIKIVQKALSFPDSGIGIPARIVRDR